jgi:CheY-like chemotaxis protein
MSLSLLVVNDQPDVAEPFRQSFRLKVHQVIYVMQFAKSGDEALELPADEIQPTRLQYSGHQHAGMDGLTLLGEIKQRFPDLQGDDERRCQSAALGNPRSCAFR